jgi:vacuolar protein sorting-associated protein 51
MSTIASPRDPSTPIPRRMNSSQAIASTPPRSSLDNPVSTTGSPNPNSSSSTTAGNASVPGSGKRANRAALREYYNLKKATNSGGASGAATPTVEISNFDTLSQTSSSDAHANETLIPPSDMDLPSFNVDTYVSQVLANQGLADLLGTYARVLSEIRALDAEKKALVYDNYSKLISATETIRKMRGAMDPLQPVAATLDPAIEKVYALAKEVNASLGRGGREASAEGQRAKENGASASDDDRARKRKRTRELAIEVLGTPERMRQLVAEGKVEEAQKLWERPRQLLEIWKEKGLGGADVQACLDEGDGVLGSADDGSGDDSED